MEFNIQVRHNIKNSGVFVEVLSPESKEFTIRICADYKGKRVLLNSRRYNTNTWFTFNRSFYTPWVIEFWYYYKNLGLRKLYEHKFDLNNKRVAFFIETSNKAQSIDYVNEIIKFCKYHNCTGTIVSNLTIEDRFKLSKNNLKFITSLSQEELDKDYYTTYTLRATPDHLKSFNSQKYNLDNECVFYTWDSPVNPNERGLSYAEQAQQMLQGIDWENGDYENGNPKHLDHWFDVYGNSFFR